MQSSPVALCLERGCHTHTHRWVKALWKGLSYCRMHQFNFWETKSVIDSRTWKETQKVSLNHDIQSESSRSPGRSVSQEQNAQVWGVCVRSASWLATSSSPFHKCCSQHRLNFVSGDFLQELISIPPHRCLLLIFMNLEFCIKFLMSQNQSMIKTRFV